MTPTNFLDSLRVIGTARQPPPPDLHVEERRRFEKAEAEHAQAVQEGKKKASSKPLMKKPKLPQELSVQERYDLRFSTPEAPPPEPPTPDKSGMRRFSEQIKGLKDSQSSTQGSDGPEPSPPTAEDGLRRASTPSVLPKLDPLQRPKWTRDMSRFKVRRSLLTPDEIQREKVVFLVSATRTTACTPPCCGRCRTTARCPERPSRQPRSGITPIWPRVSAPLRRRCSTRSTM